MKLIADSGSTKCDWALIDNEIVSYFSTRGLNPFFLSEEEIKVTLQTVKQHFQLEKQPVTIFFYGAGCSTEEKKALVRHSLSDSFKYEEISVEDDLTASVLAFDEKSPFICGILGTGSNVCYYDGNTIIKKTPSLGYILGDEASGSYFGKKLLQAYFYNTLPQNLIHEFDKLYMVTKDEVLEKVYRSANPNVYLASYFKFLAIHKEHKYIKEMVEDGFEEFFKIHICCYPNYKSINIHLIGSIAAIFKDEIVKKAEDLQINIGTIVQKPIGGLVNYHNK